MHIRYIKLKLKSCTEETWQTSKAVWKHVPTVSEGHSSGPLHSLQQTPCSYAFSLYRSFAETSRITGLGFIKIFHAHTLTAVSVICLSHQKKKKRAGENTLYVLIVSNHTFFHWTKQIPMSGNCYAVTNSWKMSFVTLRICLHASSSYFNSDKQPLKYLSILFSKYYLVNLL